MAVKTIPLGDLQQLKRIMGMTFSTNDPEALVAIRKANAILTRYQVSWEEVLGRTVGVAQAGNSYTNSGNYNGQVEPDRSLKPITEQIKDAFDALRNKNLGDFRGFIDSLEADFDHRQYLSPEQRRVLMKTVRMHSARN